MSLKWTLDHGEHLLATVSNESNVCSCKRMAWEFQRRWASLSHSMYFWVIPYGTWLSVQRSFVCLLCALLIDDCMCAIDKQKRLTVSTDTIHVLEKDIWDKLSELFILYLYRWLDMFCGSLCYPFQVNYFHKVQQLRHSIKI